MGGRSLLGPALGHKKKVRGGTGWEEGLGQALKLSQETHGTVARGRSGRFLHQSWVLCQVGTRSPLQTETMPQIWAPVGMFFEKE